MVGATVAERLARSPPGSLPGRVTGFSQAVLVPDDAVGRRVFSGISRSPPPPSFRRRFILTSINLAAYRNYIVITEEVSIQKRNKTTVDRKGAFADQAAGCGHAHTTAILDNITTAILYDVIATILPAPSVSITQWGMAMSYTVQFVCECVTSETAILSTFDLFSDEQKLILMDGNAYEAGSCESRGAYSRKTTYKVKYSNSSLEACQLLGSNADVLTVTQSPPADLSYDASRNGGANAPENLIFSVRRQHARNTNRPLCLRVRLLVLCAASLARGDTAAITPQRSPPNPAGTLPDSRMRDSCWTMPLASRYSRGTPIPAPAFQRRSILGPHVMSGDDGHLRVPAGKLLVTRIRRRNTLEVELWQGFRRVLSNREWTIPTNFEHINFKESNVTVYRGSVCSLLSRRHVSKPRRVDMFQCLWPNNHANPLQESTSISISPLPLKYIDTQKYEQFRLMEVKRSGWLLTSRAQEPMRVKRCEYGATPECMGGGSGRKISPASGIVRRDSHVRMSRNDPGHSHVRMSRNDPGGKQARFSKVGGDDEAHVNANFTKGGRIHNVHKVDLKQGSFYREQLIINSTVYNDDLLVYNASNCHLDAVFVCVTPSSISGEPSKDVKASAAMPSRRQRALYQHVSEFERSRMIGLRETGLSYRDISARTGHPATTVMRVWNQSIEEGRTQRRAGTVPRNVTTAWDDRHLVRVAVTDRTASSTALARHWSTAMGTDGHIRVKQYSVDRNLAACIVERHRGQMPSLLRVEGSLNSDRYIREVLELEVLPLLQATPLAIFQKDNAWPHVARNVQAFFNERRIQLLPWPARSPHMLPIEHVWDMVGRRLVRHGPPATAVDALCICIQTTWRKIPQERVQVFFDSMPQRLGALISARTARVCLTSVAFISGYISDDVAINETLLVTNQPAINRKKYFDYITCNEIELKVYPLSDWLRNAMREGLVSATIRGTSEAAVAERLHCSPLTKANRFKPRPSGDGGWPLAVYYHEGVVVALPDVQDRAPDTQQSLSYCHVAPTKTSIQLGIACCHLIFDWNESFKGDDTWTHNLIPKAKLQCIAWRRKDEPVLKKAKATVVFLIDYLYRGSTVVKIRYRDILKHLRVAIENKRPEKLFYKMMLLHDHPQYSPDLTPSDFHHFPYLKIHLGGLSFANDDELKEVFSRWAANIGLNLV
ncbi:hypothetical protein PR048_026113 [Dryococelus australis]|uniref:Uncharacterized protein n=1 Tax=Dryococelus australis TaxID=614101 RepID=A0ABQ9GKG0_9NEOP|nr:hypothetical protein PR048_026113 [Dryococelus australis]